MHAQPAITAPPLLGRLRPPDVAGIRRRFAAHAALVASRGIDLVLRSPATLFLLAVITATTIVQIGAGSAAAHHLVVANSSSLRHLRALDLRVLITSAFWLDSTLSLGLWLVLFLGVLAPAERWLGTGRWLLVFFCGHIGATAVTVGGIWIATAGGVAGERLEHATDVGVSYGFFAVIAALACRMPSRWRPAALGALLGSLTIAWLAGHTFTDAGHLAAAAIGVAVYALASRGSAPAPAGAPVPVPQP